MMVVVTAGLHGKAAEWVADLYSNHARELANASLFLEALHSHFEDLSRAQQAERELLALKQRGRSAADYVCEFQQVAGQLHDWFHVVTDLDASLEEFRPKGDGPQCHAGPWRDQGMKGGSPRDLVRVPLQVLLDHHLDTLLQPTGTLDRRVSSPRDPRRARDTPKKTPEKLWACTRQRAPPSKGRVLEEEKATATTRYQLVDYDSKNEAAEDPMVNEPVQPFVIPIKLTGLQTGHHGEYRALINSGCTLPDQQGHSG
ncbi:Retrotransposon-derived protein PEG10 [Crotalus adamanteus]|uniref:Retrotransposon-derived protein PEG10 n=1 Tax=Crotalus adamanteus TaxID=8729 RepID=A0AAW1B452_CROAD